ncbi:LIM domain-containing protein ajuba [Lates japonicus]|uniref:LIM domain-containing protein ajuba n=1 Tax=Lates japonicus TaxID=270547 RepID=A0AAD3R378_LATJO|nr:LIM domain-containing protein ajuba [Lates japonicus]
MGERARYSDLPGTRYQEELTRLLLRDAELEGEGLLEGLMLKEHSLMALPKAPLAARHWGRPTVGPVSTSGGSRSRGWKGGCGEHGSTLEPV